MPERENGYENHFPNEFVGTYYARCDEQVAHEGTSWNAEFYSSPLVADVSCREEVETQVLGLWELAILKHSLTGCQATPEVNVVAQCGKSLINRRFSPEETSAGRSLSGGTANTGDTV